LSYSGVVADSDVRPIRPLPRPQPLRDVGAVEFGGGVPADLLQAAAQWLLQNPEAHLVSVGWESPASDEPGGSKHVLTLFFFQAGLST
jgi:hypothetical protein